MLVSEKNPPRSIFSAGDIFIYIGKSLKRRGRSKRLYESILKGEPGKFFPGYEYEKLCRYISVTMAYYTD